MSATKYVMATAQGIINSALLELGVLKRGGTPKAQESADHLQSLISLYRAWITNGAFGALRDVVPTADYTAGENERILRTSDEVENINLPEQVPNTHLVSEYGDDIAGGMRVPRDGSVVTISDATTGQTLDYIYDGQRAQWLEIGALALNEEAPLSYRDTSGLVACLAVEVAAQYGAQLDATTVMKARRFHRGLSFNASLADPLKYRSDYV